MRKSFISNGTDPQMTADRGHDVAATRDEAEDLAPWACDIIEVDGGWMAFESAADAETWRNQR